MAVGAIAALQACSYQGYRTDGKSISSSGVAWPMVKREESCLYQMHALTSTAHCPNHWTKDTHAFTVRTHACRYSILYMSIPPAGEKHPYYKMFVQQILSLHMAAAEQLSLRHQCGSGSHLKSKGECTVLFPHKLYLQVESSESVSWNWEQKVTFASQLVTHDHNLSLCLQALF